MDTYCPWKRRGADNFTGGVALIMLVIWLYAISSPQFFSNSLRGAGASFGAACGWALASLVMIAVAYGCVYLLAKSRAK